MAEVGDASAAFLVGGVRIEARCTPIVGEPVVDELGQAWSTCKAGPVRWYVNGVRLPYRVARWIVGRLA